MCRCVGWCGLPRRYSRTFQRQKRPQLDGSDGGAVGGRGVLVTTAVGSKHGRPAERRGASGSNHSGADGAVAAAAAAGGAGGQDTEQNKRARHG
jgi:hypothetical protein